MLRASIIKLRQVALPILGRTVNISFRSFATVCELAVEFGVSIRPDFQ
jgi:hypothetical protein